MYECSMGREVQMGKTTPEGLSMLRALLKTKSTVFLCTDQPRPANNFFLCSFESCYLF